MASFKVDSQTNTNYNAGADFNSMLNQSSQHRHGNTSFEDYGSYGYGTGFYSVVGVNTQQIPSMKAAIEQYQEHLNYIVSWLENDVTVSDAFRGANVPEALVEYIYNVKYLCECIISYFNVFKTKLDSISAAWTTSTENMGQRVKNASGDISNDFNKQEVA